MIEFVEFPKIARLSRGCVITEKIDGTNASIFITDDASPITLESGRVVPFHAGSRTRWVYPENDNHGFARWAYEHAAELLTLGPGHHFGEWWGGGVQRGYGLQKGEKRFSLFNVSRWAAFGTEPKRIPQLDPRVEKYQQVAPACCSVVPVLYSGLFATQVVEDVIEGLRRTGSVAAPGFMNPEGVVVWHEAARILFKKTLEKDEAPKGANRG